MKVFTEVVNNLPLAYVLTNNCHFNTRGHLKLNSIRNDFSGGTYLSVGDFQNIIAKSIELSGYTEKELYDCITENSDKHPSVKDLTRHCDPDRIQSMTIYTALSHFDKENNVKIRNMIKKLPEIELIPIVNPELQYIANKEFEKIPEDVLKAFFKEYEESVFEIVVPLGVRYISIKHPTAEHRISVTSCELDVHYYPSYEDLGCYIRLTHDYDSSLIIENDDPLYVLGQVFRDTFMHQYGLQNNSFFLERDCQDDKILSMGCDPITLNTIYHLMNSTNIVIKKE